MPQSDYASNVHIPAVERIVHAVRAGNSRTQDLSFKSNDPSLPLRMTNPHTFVVHHSAYVKEHAQWNPLA